ncbi:MAG: YncE family protein, partial [Planctomycetes bacterium]|nr:YncE family protein [Planctomycetota bacterium]
MSIQSHLLLSWSIVIATCLSGCGAAKPALVGASRDGHFVPTSQLIRPAGNTVEFAGRPVDIVAHPGGQFIYVKDHRGIVVLDREMKSVRQQLGFSGGGGSMHGLAINSDGTRLWATDAQSSMHEATIDAKGSVSWTRKISLPGPNGNGASHSTGIAISADEKTAYVCQSRNNTLAIVDLESGSRVSEIAVGIAPYDVIISDDGKRAYVSDWGGRHPEDGDLTANSSGTEVIVDERGVGASGCVSFVDLDDPRNGRQVALVDTGLHPAEMVLTGDESTLYVTCVNSDRVDIIDTATAT